MAHFIVICAPPAIWFLHFVLLYGAETLACRSQNGPAIMTWIGAVATAAALGSLFLVATAARRTPPGGQHHFQKAVVVILAMLCGTAVLWTALALPFVRACAPT